MPAGRCEKWKNLLKKMHIGKTHLQVESTIKTERRKREEQEASWLPHLALPAGLCLPHRVQKRGDRWLFEDAQQRLWSIAFAPPEQADLFLHAEQWEKRAEAMGFFLLPDRYYGTVEVTHLQNGNRRFSWILQREGGKNPLRCWLPQTDMAQHRKSGYALGKAVHAFQEQAEVQTEDSLSNGWSADFQTDIDYLLYRHGRVGNKTRREYVLIDFISEARHWMHALPEKSVIGSVTIDRLHGVRGGFALDDWSRVRRGDGAYDLVFLNDVAEFSPTFCRAFLEGYSGGNTARSTYRLLSFYTAVTTLKRLVDVAEGAVQYQDMAHATRRFEEIVDSFHDFSSVVPDWAEKH